MHIYNTIHYVKDIFAPNPVLPCPMRNADAALLANMALRTMNLRARNGNKYWYYFLRDTAHRDVVRFLMRRNGLRPEYHISRYEGRMFPAPVFRVLCTQISENAILQEFIGLIELSAKDMDADSYRAQITSVINQMHQKSK